MIERILYLPIFEPGTNHDLQRRTKHGLRDALARRGEVREYDYCALPRDRMIADLLTMLRDFAPTLLFMQIQGDDRFMPADLAFIRETFPAMKIVNWNGDFWPEHLTSQPMLDILRHVDLQLVINASVLPTYEQHGIRAAYWQFGYETAVDPLPDVPAYDVVFLGNNYSEKRKELGKLLKSLPCKVGLYGSGWGDLTDGQCTYDFAYGEALYRKAKIAIDDSQWPDATGYTSNRILQAMYAGCFVLHQYVKGLDEHLHLYPGKHYGEFMDLSELPVAVEYWLARDDQRAQIAQAAQAEVFNRHSFDARVTQLFDELLLEVAHAY